jgi:hypothetical protein
VELLLRPALLSQDNTAEGGGSSADKRDDAQLSFAEQALKRQRVQDKTEGSKYINTRFLLPNSGVVERLFSQANQVFQSSPAQAEHKNTRGATFPQSKPTAVEFVYSCIGL